MSIIQITDVTKVFPARSKAETPLAALDGVSLDIEKGDIYGIIGYSGAGKSTLVRLINALEKPTSGSVVVDGVEVSALRESALRSVRLGIGMVFQQFNLFNSRTVWGNIEYPLTVAGVPKEQHQARISELLHFVGLVEHAHAYPDQLSGGQKQRVGIARALATSPAILLADEATSALDPETTREVLTLLKRVNEEFGITIVVITHEMEVIRSIAHKVAVMEKGRIVERGDVFDIFSAPVAEATKRFVSTIVTSVPEGDSLDALRLRHPGRIVTFSFADGSTAQSAVFLTLGDAEVGFELIYGGINEVQAKTFGHLTLALTGDDASIDGALARIAEVATVTEVK
ncbi:D-methionine transport system ATP-binding protein [Conyzicola lurida]|uniref:D-methionine transport system ATP-binding protein n=1 Tax=Conyzicola lurida TaxID=1172621 RepID=A0A841AG51_9MICO|nr:methionine ABC transporter ATP-binding protein [Conyzicola lurida]MBB5842217.1 D-methionine transport system ATP-binding protein [Conyzicola lurida]